jgi:hypothetical protein
MAVGLADTLIDAATATSPSVSGAALVFAAVAYTAIIGIRLGTGADAAVAHAAVAHTTVIHARLYLKRFVAD